MQDEIIKAKDEEGQLLEMAEQSSHITNTIIEKSQIAQELVKAINIIKKACLQLTSSDDWCLINGHPWLQEKGAIKIAQAFGLSWRIIAIEKKIENTKYDYETKLEISDGKRKIETIGTSSSADKFFSIRYNEKGEKIVLEMSDVCENDVKKKSYTNALVNGITRMLGLRSISARELEQAGITIKTEIEFKSKGEIEKAIEKLKTLCMELSEGDEAKAKEMCREYSRFQKDGKWYEGRDWDTFPKTEKGLKWIHSTISKIEKDKEAL